MDSLVRQRSNASNSSRQHSDSIRLNQSNFTTSSGIHSSNSNGSRYQSSGHADRRREELRGRLNDSRDRDSRDRDGRHRDSRNTHSYDDQRLGRKHQQQPRYDGDAANGNGRHAEDGELDYQQKQKGSRRLGSVIAPRAAATFDDDEHDDDEHSSRRTGVALDGWGDPVADAEAETDAVQDSAELTLADKSADFARSDTGDSALTAAAGSDREERFPSTVVEPGDAPLEALENHAAAEQLLAQVPASENPIRIEDSLLDDDDDDDAGELSVVDHDVEIGTEHAEAETEELTDA